MVVMIEKKKKKKKKKKGDAVQGNGDEYSFRRDIARELLELSIKLHGRGESVNNEVRLKLNSVIGRLDPRYSLSLLDVRTPDGDSSVYDQADTCREVYLDRKQGYPYYQTGFTVSPDCPNFKRETPISKLVSIILLDTKGTYLNTVIKGIRNYSRDIQILVASGNIQRTSLNYTLSYAVNEEIYNTPGNLLNTMVGDVKTPYVLIAKDLTHFTNYSRVERLVHLLPKSSPVGVAAGSTRNLTGHWKQGCQQTDIRNYLLHITHGYLHSTQDCMFCDHVSDPFLVKTEVLRKVTFDETLPFQILFNDWFLQLKESGILAVTCPDIMFFINGEEEPWHEHWLALARKMQISRIFLSPNKHFKFTCEELSLSCDPWDWTEHFLLPTCCFEQIRNTLSKLHSFAEMKNMAYELDSGSQLAAVKLQGHSPWDLDGDLQYNSKFYEHFKIHNGSKSQSGIYFDDFMTEYKKFKIFTPKIYIEMWGMDTLSSSLFLPEDLRNTPTLMPVMGLWIRGQANPGLYARNKYGPNHLKHALFYLFNNHSEWDEYKTAGKWPSCPKKHHACVNRYPGDGSVHFTPHYFYNLGITWDDI
ncbi:uncharacterized protein [Anabrus simplex]|uniref:uncharacterized protein n=1 Tax=Anabrus simplex TaxID=316456 RepID=UPI0035A2C6C0